jgi:hypothetical protein
MAFTVVPIHNLNLGAGIVIPFGKFTIQPVPQWLLKDSILDDVSRHDRTLVNNAKHALVSDYFADSYGFPDPAWTGTNPEGIQVLRWQSALLANMCIWMIMPSPVCVSVGFHALTNIGGQALDEPHPDVIEHETTLFCHERDFQNRPSVNDFQRAAKLFETLSTVGRKNSVSPALRAIWAALTFYQADMRYPLFWQGLESLFGSDKDRSGITKRLCNRISYFLAGDHKTQKELYDKVDDCYDQRSAIVHGRWEDSKEFHDVQMYTTEAIVRTVIRHISDKPGMLNTFISQERNDFFEAWVKSKAFTPPTVF